MSTDTCREIETFYQFLGERIQEGSIDLSPEESVEAFRAYQRDHRISDAPLRAASRPGNVLYAAGLPAHNQSFTQSCC